MTVPGFGPGTLIRTRRIGTRVGTEGVSRGLNGRGTRVGTRGVSRRLNGREGVRALGTPVAGTNTRVRLSADSEYWVIAEGEPIGTVSRAVYVGT